MTDFLLIYSITLNYINTITNMTTNIRNNVTLVFTLEPIYLIFKEYPVIQYYTKNLVVDASNSYIIKPGYPDAELGYRVICPN